MGIQGGPNKGIHLQALLRYDETTFRKVTIDTNYYNDFFKNKPWSPQRIIDIYKSFLRRSDIPMTMTRSQFFEMEFKKFNNFIVTNKLFVVKQ